MAHGKEGSHSDSGTSDMRTTNPATIMTSSIVPDNLVARWLLVMLLLVAAYFFIGFLVPILAALVIGFASWPLYQRLLQFNGGRSTSSATIAVSVITLGLVVPIVLALSYAVEEIAGWLDWLLIANREGLPAPVWISQLPGVGEWLTEQWNEYLSEPHALNSVVSLVHGQHLGNISLWVLTLSGSALNFMLAMLFMLITLFFIYKDGTRFAAQLDVVGEHVLPTRWQRFSRVVPTTVSATVVGMALVAVGEGVILGVAYWIAGVPSHFALGVLTGFMALIPGGAPLAFTLVSLYLFGTNQTAAAIGLFIWGSLELFIVDKTIRPRLVGGPIKLPFLPTFFGLVGGVKTLGLVGLFVGPVLMALIVAIWREWLHDCEYDMKLSKQAAQPTSDVTDDPLV